MMWWVLRGWEIGRSEFLPQLMHFTRFSYFWPVCHLNFHCLRNLCNLCNLCSQVGHNFWGSLKPPFNDEARKQAGFEEAWYLPLVGKTGHRRAEAQAVSAVEAKLDELTVS